MDAIFKALADKNRREFLDDLRHGNGKTLGKLCKNLEMSSQAVSKHLKILEQANLVVTVWKGREKFHYFNPVPIREIEERWIRKYDVTHLDALSTLKKAIEEKEKK